MSFAELFVSTPGTVKVYDICSKFLLSYRKNDWKAGDYPLVYRDFDPKAVGPEAHPGLIPCIVQIARWWNMTGCGSNREGAYLDLKRNLEEYRKKHGGLPRPGTAVRKLPC